MAFGHTVIDLYAYFYCEMCIRDRFHLPISLADEVTRNYISHIVQVLKLSNQQLSHALDMKQITQVVLDNVSEGFCLLDENRCV